MEGRPTLVTGDHPTLAMEDPTWVQTAEGMPGTVDVIRTREPVRSATLG
jgi:hypothetical protein